MCIRDKVFYLIIDRDGEEEMVYFLTEITENDLLNATSDNSETLPKNSAALESAIPTEEGALPNNNGEQPEDTEPAGKMQEIRKIPKVRRNRSRSRKKRQSRTLLFPISLWAHLQSPLSAALIISR